MIVYNESAKLHIAKETSWASDGIGRFKVLPFISDSLTPQMVQERPQGLGQSVGRSAPITVEESASGDVALIGSRDHLKLLLPYILNHSGFSHEVSLEGKTATTAGALPLGFLEANIKKELIDGDVIWLTAGSVAQWGNVKIGNDNVPRLHGLKASQSFTAGDKMTITSYVPGAVRASMRMVKAYDGAAEKMQIKGGMIQRLVIDLEEGALPQFSASVIAKEMTVMSDTVSASVLSEKLPRVATHDISLSLVPENGAALTLENTMVTGIRLVMERAGMAAQFALGQKTPRHISTGDVTLYGAIDVIFERYDLFTEMAGQKGMAMTLHWGDGGDEKIAIHIPQVTFSEGHLLAGDAHEPVRAAFQFEASIKDSLPLVKVNLSA